MWDRTRARRQISNSFFATINAALVAAIAAKDSIALFSPYVCISGIVLCVLWFFYILTYKKRSDAKQTVILQMEGFLQHRPFSDENELFVGRVLTLTIIERGIPVAFFIIYAFALLHFFLHKSVLGESIIVYSWRI
ncbi:MAG: hypothetical protein WA624_06945 [Methylocella sp.]